MLEQPEDPVPSYEEARHAKVRENRRAMIADYEVSWPLFRACAYCCVFPKLISPSACLPSFVHAIFVSSEQRATAKLETSYKHFNGTHIDPGK
jgi:hypothetical protein